jgi:hypothetical protein
MNMNGVTPRPPVHLLQLTEGVTRQQATLLVDADQVRTVGQGLELFRHPPEELIARGQLVSDLTEPFLEMGECLFTLTSDGKLGPPAQGVALTQGTEPRPPDAPLLFERRPLVDSHDEVMLARLTVDRRNGWYERDWTTYHRRKLRQGERDLGDFIRQAATSSLGEDKAAALLARRDHDAKATLLRAVAHRVFEAPFELYSRFVGQRRLIKDGLATMRNIARGHGGACSEKVQVLRLAAEFLELPARFLLAGPNARGDLPTGAMLEALETCEFDHLAAVQAYWNHLALLIEVEGQEILVDGSNGNIPFLWVSGQELRGLLDHRGSERKGVPHRYVVGRDELFYHRVDQTVPERLLYALELGWADPHIDLVQVLDDELGLLTMPDLWLGVLPYRDDEEREVVRQWYRDEWLNRGRIRGLTFTSDPERDEAELAAELRLRYPAAAKAATEGRGYVEYRLEEANPGSGYHIEFVIAGRWEHEPAGEPSESNPSVEAP